MIFRVKANMVDRKARCTGCKAEFRFRDALIPGQNPPAFHGESGRESQSAVASAGSPLADHRRTSQESGWEERREFAARAAIDALTIPLARPLAVRDADDEETPSPATRPPRPGRSRRFRSDKSSESWVKRHLEFVVIVVGLAFVVLVPMVRWRARPAMKAVKEWLQPPIPKPDNNAEAVVQWVDSHYLNDARRGFQTELIQKAKSGIPVAAPPPDLLRVVRYDSDVGRLAVYITPDPEDDKRHPALIWLGGDDCNTIGDVWRRADASNDRTGAAFRNAGIITMYPSLRGGNDNPGYNEALFGEVDDVLAAADFLAGQSYVDPKRIYLGGQHLGATLALLVAESSDHFRGVFAFGPAPSGLILDARGMLPYPQDDLREVAVRSPGFWLHSIRSPVYIIQGLQFPSSSPFSPPPDRPQNPMVHFLLVRNASHNAVLAPVTALIAQKIIEDTGAQTNLSLTFDEVNQIFDATRTFRSPPAPEFSTPTPPPDFGIPWATAPRAPIPPTVGQLPILQPPVAPSDLPLPVGPQNVPRAGRIPRGLPPGRIVRVPVIPPRAGVQPPTPQSRTGGL
jgi:hypothetical protein